jgi:hypothetical protein
MAQQTKAQRSQAAKKAAATRQRNAGEHAGDDAKKSAERAVGSLGDAAKSAGQALRAAGKATATRLK